MGKRLRDHGVKPDLIISSPARRTLRTAKIIAKQIGFPPKEIVTDRSMYESDAFVLLEVIRDIDDSFDRVMLFGHNPGFTTLANDLTDVHVENIPTCGILCVDFEMASWKEISERRGIFRFFDYPKKHL